MKSAKASLRREECGVGALSELLGGDLMGLKWAAEANALRCCVTGGGKTPWNKKAGVPAPGHR